MTLSRRRSSQVRPSLEQYRSEIARCVRCGSCRAVCPPALHQKSESYAARGRLALIRAVLEGRLALSDAYRDRLVTCAGCLACEDACPSGVPVAAIIQAAKEQAVEEAGPDLIRSVVGRVLKSPGVLRSLAWLAPLALRIGRAGGEGRMLAREHRAGSSEGGLSEDVPAPGPRKRVIFFPGCAVSSFQRDVARSTVSVLTRLGYDVVIPKDAPCCGKPLLSLGDRAGAEELAARTASLFSALGADLVVTACASCGLTFKKEYPTLLPPEAGMPAVLDIHEILSEGLPGRFLAPLELRVTWHEPCHLGRGQGLSGLARHVLRSVPGVELLEMKHADQCCGFGGVMRITHHGISEGIGQRKARDIIATGAAAAVTGCPGCSMQIADALRRAGADIEVFHTVQVIEASLACAGQVKEPAAAAISR